MAEKEAEWGDHQGNTKWKALVTLESDKMKCIHVPWKVKAFGEVR